MDRSDTSGFVSGGGGFYNSPCNNKMYSSFCGDFIENSDSGDTIMRLDGIGYGTRDASAFADSQANGFDQNARTDTLDDGCKLVLGLGPTPSAYSYEYSTYTSNKAKGPAPVSDQGPLSQCSSILKLGLTGSGGAVSESLVFYHFDTYQADRLSSYSNRLAIPVADEGSTSAKKTGGYMKNLIMAPRMEDGEIFFARNQILDHGAKSHIQLSQPSSEPPAFSSYSTGTVSGSGNTNRNMEKCEFDGCTKGARGAAGMCIVRGGGPRCEKPGCSKGTETFCKAHGGGRRYQHLGCTKSAEGKTDRRAAQGGVKWCGYPSGCTKAARGRSGLCIRHGGGKRCNVEGCTRSAEGQIGLCISHGGGRRCRVLGCIKGAQGSTDFCKAHGGGKRCIFAGCTKGAEGSTSLCKGHGGGKRCSFDGGGICPKSVHGGTDLCVAHGGGKRCSVPGCTKSARGRTDCCVKHGGGRRCRFENCGKSAQGSTDLCKAHGGGKRCSWGEEKCEKFARGKSGLCAAHSSMVNGRETKRVGIIGPGLFSGLVPPAAPMARGSFENTCSSSGVSVVLDLVKSTFEKPAKRQQLIPPQVLVPLSMKGGSKKDQETSFGLVVPEGRVHGGGLLSLLGGDLNNAINGM
ncbi:hypothetical protein OROHE_018917 [Orobanche hederae]